MAALQSIQINWFSASVQSEYTIMTKRFDLEQKIKNFYFYITFFFTWHLLKKYVGVFRNILFYENDEHLKKKYYFWLKNFEQKC